MLFIFKTFKKPKVLSEQKYSDLSHELFHLSIIQECMLATVMFTSKTVWLVITCVQVSKGRDLSTYAPTFTRERAKS